MFQILNKDYQSDTTQFLQSMKKDRPSIQQGQLAGRALLWDQRISRPLQKEMKQGKIEQQPYVYQTE